MDYRCQYFFFFWSDYSSIEAITIAFWWQTGYDMNEWMNRNKNEWWKSKVKLNSFIHLDNLYRWSEKKPRIRTRKHILIFNLLSIVFLILILRYGWMFQVQFKELEKNFFKTNTHCDMCNFFSGIWKSELISFLQGKYLSTHPHTRPQKQQETTTIMLPHTSNIQVNFLFQFNVQ